LNRYSPVVCLQLSGTILSNYFFYTSYFILSNPPIDLPLMNTDGYVGQFE